jgi:hypothetical protein
LPGYLSTKFAKFLWIHLALLTGLVFLLLAIVEGYRSDGGLSILSSRGRTP